MRTINRRRRRGADAWQVLVSGQAESGLPVAAFCRREGIGTCSFYAWRSRLQVDGGKPEMAVAKSAVAQSPSSQFIDLGALGGGTARCQIRLDLGGGVVLQVVRG